MTLYISAILRYRANMAFVVGAGCMYYVTCKGSGYLFGCRDCDCIAAQGYDTLPT